MENEANDRWQYCVVGNIVRTHPDEDGRLRYGTVAYSGGTKVYLCGKLWDPKQETIEVIGLARKSRKYRVNPTPVALIENVRLSRTYHPEVLRIMNNWEYDSLWWGSSAEDRASAAAFAEAWRRRVKEKEKEDCYAE